LRKDKEKEEPARRGGGLEDFAVGREGKQFLFFCWTEKREECRI